MRYALLLFALTFTACESPEVEPIPARETDTDETAVAPADDWTGTWSWDETWPGSGDVTNVLSYTLVLGEFEGTLQGGLGIDGYQTMKNYEVRGTPRGDALDVTVSGYGEGHVGTPDDLGERLFSLVRTDSGGYMTIWDTLRPAIGEAGEQDAFAKE